MTVLRRIWALLSPRQRRQAVVLLFLTFIGMVLETLGLGLVIPVIALLTRPELATGYPIAQGMLTWLGNPTPAQLVTAGMMALVVAHVGRVTFLGYLAWRQMGFACQQQAQLSERLFAIYLRQPYAFHLNRNSAQLIQNAVGEVRLFTFNVVIPATVLFTEGAIMAGMAAVLVIVEPAGAGVVVVSLGMAAWVFQRVVRRAIDSRAAVRQRHEGLRLQHLQQGLGGAKDVKLLGREDDFLADYARHNHETARIARFQLTLQQLPRLWLEILAVGALAALILTMRARGEDVAAIVPTLGLFAAAAFRLMPSVNRFMGAFQSLRFGAPVVETLYREIQLEESVARKEIAARREFVDRIDLTGVDYTYPGAPAPALTSISLAIRRGESVGFVGASGSGKSTLVDIILGLLVPDAGRVEVDGRNIHPHVRTWQDNVGYVPQSIYLTDDSIRRNVAFGLPPGQIDDAAVTRALAAAQLDDLVTSLPDGLDTLVGERGIRLSGGQRQRIGIARALYGDPSVLVLDEATSALDMDTEREVMAAVAALRGAKTLLIVAHRLSTVEQCDRLYRLEDGRIAEASSPLPLRAAATSC
jgi:ATP-binding cassette, subfamily B, bacterial PglK